MSIFHAHYGCHEGALVMRKADGMVFRVRGNAGLWDMTAVLVPHNPDPKPLSLLEEYDGSESTEGWVSAKPDEFKRDFLILDEGKDKLSDGLRALLRNIAR